MCSFFLMCPFQNCLLFSCVIVCQVILHSFLIIIVQYIFGIVLFQICPFQNYPVHFCPVQNFPFSEVLCSGLSCFKPFLARITISRLFLFRHCISPGSFSSSKLPFLGFPFSETVLVQIVPVHICVFSVYPFSDLSCCIAVLFKFVIFRCVFFEIKSNVSELAFHEWPFPELSRSELSFSRFFPVQSCPVADDPFWDCPFRMCPFQKYHRSEVSFFCFDLRLRLRLPLAI